MDSWTLPAWMGRACVPANVEGKMNRRDWIRTSFAATAVTALGSRQVMGANARIRVGLIGSGGRGKQDWATFLKQSDVEPVAVCDLYDPDRKKGIEMTEGRAK